MRRWYDTVSRPRPQLTTKLLLDFRWRSRKFGGSFVQLSTSRTSSTNYSRSSCWHGHQRPTRRQCLPSWRRNRIDGCQCWVTSMSKVSLKWSSTSMWVSIVEYRPLGGGWLCTQLCMCVVSSCPHDISKTNFMDLCKIYSKQFLCTAVELINV